MTLHPDARALIEYWFGKLDDAGLPPDDRYSLWFGVNPDVDAQLRAAFGGLPAQADVGELDDWVATPEGLLAAILVTDQLPRNLHRDSAKAFAHDARACRWALAGIDSGADRGLPPIQRVFFYLPLEHAENLGLQDRSVTLFEQLEREAPPGGARMFAAFTEYARKHREVIARFGRFPHRNGVLGRATTDEEARYLAEHGRGF